MNDFILQISPYGLALYTFKSRYIGDPLLSVFFRIVGLRTYITVFFPTKLIFHSLFTSNLRENNVLFDTTYL